MFTGIVQGVCGVVRVESGAGITTLDIDLGQLAEDLGPGASVAVNGTCLTAVAVDGGVVRFEVVSDTRERTNLGELAAGAEVNIERSFRVGDEVGGHVLSGHTSTVATVTAIEASAGQKRVALAVPREWTRYLMAKGFVALNGASLTIQELDRERAAIVVSLIPETLARTTFGGVAVGCRVNLEVDAQTQAVVDTVRAMLPELLAERRVIPADAPADAAVTA